MKQSKLFSNTLDPRFFNEYRIKSKKNVQHFDVAVCYCMICYCIVYIDAAVCYCIVYIDVAVCYCIVYIDEQIATSI
jgi:hypothetical protein